MRNSFAWQRDIGLVVAALLCAAGTWICASRVLIPHQVMEDAEHGRPRGNFSDLYPRWLGARELLLRGRNPYGADVTREIQAGYYGRPLDPSRASDPRDEQGFAYPVYVTFLLAPIVRAPFVIVQRCFFWFLLALTAASVLVWVRVLRWPAQFTTRIATLLLVLGCLPAMQGLKLQQLTLLVAGMLAIAILLLVEGYTVVAGIILCLATIKPQLVLLLIVWLAIWTTADWRRRYRWGIGFVVAVAILFAASEWYLPHWLGSFWQATRDYRQYADAVGVLETLCGPVWGRTLELLALAAMLSVCWNARREAADSDSFAFVTALVLTITALVVPKTALYNQVLLVPAAMALTKERRAIWQRGLASRAIFTAAAGLVLWPWIASIVLTFLSLRWPDEMVARGANAPFWSAPFIPVGVAAAMLVQAANRTFAASGKASTS